MIGMSPKDTIELKEVSPVNQESYSPEDTLAEDRLYQYFLQPGEEHDDQHKRAMDRIWSKKTYRLSEIMEESGNWVMYYLSDGPKSLRIRRVDAHSRRHGVASQLHPKMVVSIQLG